MTDQILNNFRMTFLWFSDDFLMNFIVFKVGPTRLLIIFQERSKFQNIEHRQFQQLWKRRWPKHPGDPSCKFLNILDIWSITWETHGKHGKLMGIMTYVIVLSFFEFFWWKPYLKNMFKSFLEFICFRLVW